MHCNRFILVLCMGIWMIVVNAQSSSDVQSYIERYKRIALEQEKAYGIPASITLAQGILESGAGKSILTQRANNHFGIKAYGDWDGGVYYAWDDERTKSPFRQYATAEESFKDYALFLKNNSRYRSLFTKSVYDYRAWATGLQHAGYATADGYAKALIGYIDAYRLYNMNGGVKLKPGKTVTIVSYVTEGQPVFGEDCRLDETEETEEQKNILKVMHRVVVEINDVRCTVLYPGETLASISQKYDIPKSKLLDYNETGNESDMQEGDIVFLEKKKNKYTGAQDYYLVKSDDTLYAISQKFGIKVASLAKMNDKDLFSTLAEGEMLELK